MEVVELKSERVQRLRKRGWRMPENAVYVGRPTKWGNPFKVGIDGNLDEVLQKYEKYLKVRINLDPHFLSPLRGKDLACWCPLNQPCHADILLKWIRNRIQT